MSAEINDKRLQKEFTGISFSKYKKSDVKKQLKQAILNNRIEQANYWCAEMVCAGHFLDIWETIILISNKHIHYGNPKLPIYISMRFDNFKDVLMNGYVDNELKMRNNSQIRRLFGEIISILVFSQKKHSFDIYKIKQSDFDLTEINFRLKADGLSYACELFSKSDPKEIFIAMNELAFSISKNNTNRNSSDACYWIDWIIQFETISKKKKELVLCDKRSNMPVSQKFQRDIIWIMWELFMSESRKNHPQIITKILESLLTIFSLHYSSGVKKRRRYILYFIVSLLTEKVNINIPLYTDKNIIDGVVDKIDLIYKDLKKNEITPDTEYLFNGLKQNNTNLEKTIEKLDKLSSTDFIPRC